MKQQDNSEFQEIFAASMVCVILSVFIISWLTWQIYSRLTYNTLEYAIDHGDGDWLVILFALPSTVMLAGVTGYITAHFQFREFAHAKNIALLTCIVTSSVIIFRAIWIAYDNSRGQYEPMMGMTVLETAKIEFLTFYATPFLWSLLLVVVTCVLNFKCSRKTSV